MSPVPLNADDLRALACGSQVNGYALGFVVPTPNIGSEIRGIGTLGYVEALRRRNRRFLIVLVVESRPAHLERPLRFKAVLMRQIVEHEISVLYREPVQRERFGQVSSTDLVASRDDGVTDVLFDLRIGVLGELHECANLLVGKGMTCLAAQNSSSGRRLRKAGLG